MCARSCASSTPNWPRESKVNATPERNFAGRLVQRLGPNSCLIDAAAARAAGPEDLPRLIAAQGRALLAAGLRPGDRVLLGCSLAPAYAPPALPTPAALLAASRSAAYWRMVSNSR